MADGARQKVRPRGDEFFNWTEAADGFAVARGENGRWQYARREKGRWVPSGRVPQQRGLEGRRADPPTHTSPFDGAAAALSVTGDGSPGSPVLSSVSAPAPAKLLVVLVSFADRGFTYGSNTPSFWADKFFGAGGKTINTYYGQVSKNRFWFNPAEETQGATNDGIVNVTLTINHPNTTAFDDTVRSAVKAALIAADPYVNYKAFDKDNNGTLSMAELHIVLVFAGYEASYSTVQAPLVWAHHWSLFSTVPAPQLDGVYVGSSNGGGYLAVGEIHNNHSATIGVICHELGHNLGLPDLYDTDGSSDGVGTHCLMGAGNWAKTGSDSYQGQTPVLMSAYCRLLIGFSDARTAVGTGTASTLTQVSDSSNVTDMVRINTPNAQQYFLVENRQLTGFDAGLSYYLGAPSGGGLAVWHIDTSVANNANDTRRLVDLEEAASPVLDVAGLPLGNIMNYYYANNVTRFDETTSPSSVLNGGAASLVRVYNVSAAGAQMSFNTDEGVSLEAGLDVGATQPVTSGGSVNWVWQTAVTHDGIDAVQSGMLNKSATNAWMETAVTGPVQVAFWWKHAASGSETLRFLVDGVQKAATNAVTDWVRQRHVVPPGAHTLRWEFSTTRNNGTANQAYVDQLTVAPPSKGTTFIVR
jgi:M6 family metalloprotease-like protein